MDGTLCKLVLVVCWFCRLLILQLTLENISTKILFQRRLISLRHNCIKSSKKLTRPRIKDVTAIVSSKDPLESKALNICQRVAPLLSWMPISRGIVTHEIPAHISNGATWIPKAHRHPIDSANAPPSAAPRAAAEP